MKTSKLGAKVEKKPGATAEQKPGAEAEVEAKVEAKEEARVPAPTEAETARWEAEAARRVSKGGRWNIPWAALMGEAVDVARFAEEHWSPKRDPRTGAELRPGLVAVESRLSKEVIRELLVLQQLAQRASAELSMAAGPKDSADLREDATRALSEMIAGLEFLFDDDVQDESDEQLARLREKHPSVEAADKMAAALDDYAVLAEAHRGALAAFGGFDVGVIDEAREHAKKLRELPNRAAQSALSNEQREAKDRRDGLALLLLDRMQRVRSAARFVFRDHPAVVRLVTSEYERRRRAEALRAKAAKAEAAKAEAEKKNAPPAAEKTPGEKKE